MLIEICNFVSQRSNVSGVYFIGGFLMADYEAMCNGNHPCIEKTKIYGAIVDDADLVEKTAEQKPVVVPVDNKHGVMAFVSMAIKAGAEMVMIDFSNVSKNEVSEKNFKLIDEAITNLFLKAGYVDSKSYEQRWSFVRIPDGCLYDRVNGVFVKEEQSMSDKISIEEVRSDMGAIKYFYDKYVENEIQLGTLTTCINTFYHKYDDIIEIKSGEIVNKKDLSKDIHNVKKTIDQMDSMCKNGCTYESLKPLFNYINFLNKEAFMDGYMAAVDYFITYELDRIEPKEE